MRSEFKVTLKKPQGKEKRNLLLIPKEPLVRQYLILAHQIKRVIEKEPHRTLKEISEWIGYSPAGLSQIMRLLFLCPYIQEQILLSNDPSLHQVSVSKVSLIAAELLWEKQKEIWGKLKTA